MTNIVKEVLVCRTKLAKSALDKTLDWHDAWRRGDDMRQTTLSQIADYLRTAVDAACESA